MTESHSGIADSHHLRNSTWPVRGRVRGPIEKPKLFLRFLVLPIRTICGAQRGPDVARTWPGRGPDVARHVARLKNQYFFKDFWS